MKRNIIIPIIIFSFGFLIWLYFSLPIQNKYETQELKIDVIIGNYTGINLDTDAVHFGTIEKGEATTRTREVIIANTYNKSRRIYLAIHGRLPHEISLSESQFLLLPNKNKTIQVVLKINPEVDYGVYNGTLKAIFKEAG